MSESIIVAIVGVIGLIIGAVITLIWNIYNLNEIKKNQQELLEIQHEFNEKSTKMGFYFEWRAQFLRDFLDWINIGISLVIELTTYKASISTFQLNKSKEYSEEEIEILEYKNKQKQIEINEKLLEWQRQAVYYSQIFSNMNEFYDFQADQIILDYSQSISEAIGMSEEEYLENHYNKAINHLVELIKIFDKTFVEK